MRIRFGEASVFLVQPELKSYSFALKNLNVCEGGEQREEEAEYYNVPDGIIGEGWVSQKK